MDVFESTAKPTSVLPKVQSRLYSISHSSLLLSLDVFLLDREGEGRREERGEGRECEREGRKKG